MIKLPGLAALGAPGLFAGLLILEAGIPLPVPADLLMLLVGERAAAGAIPAWAAVVGLEVVALLGTAVLFFAVRGPANAVIARIGPRVGVTQARLARASGLLERRGRPALLLGRTTPGLRTLTVVAAAGSTLPARICLPLLFAGSSVFLQAHFVLGYLLGPLARESVRRAGLLPLAALVALLLIGGAVLWLRRRRRVVGVRAWTEACCPACLASAALGLGLEPPPEAPTGYRQ